MTTDTQRRLELDAIEEAYAIELGQRFSVLCYNLAAGEKPDFSVALANVRLASEIALDAINTKETSCT